MKKLVERESAPGASRLAAVPALAVQFFLIPLGVVATVVLIYGGFRMMLTSERTPAELLADVRAGGLDRGGAAAYELAWMLADPETEAQNPWLGDALVQLFEDTEGGDPRVRRYLAWAIGRLASPPANAVDVLRAALSDPDNETLISVIWALASLGGQSAVGAIEAAYQSDDAGVRKMAVYALGTLAGTGDHATLRNALDDPAPDVRWNAAVALARHGRDDGMTVLRRMLDRAYVERLVTRSATIEAPIDPVSEVIVSGLQAAATLRAAELREPIEALSETDASLRVREVAMKTLDVLNQSTRSRAG